MSADNVEIVGAPGFVDRFRARLIPGLDHVPAVDGRGDLAVITTEVGDIHVVPASTVHPIESGEYEA